MSEIQDNLKSKNAEYASKFDKGSLALPPAKKYIVVTCMDARIDPAAAFGIDLGDAHVIRNAGGNTEDAYRSVLISHNLLATNEIVVIKHTGCGMLTFQNADARGAVKANHGDEAGAEVAELDFQPFPDLDEAVKADVQRLRKSKAIAPAVKISGWVYEVETGKVRQVV